jgi:hypothetical protein
LAAVDICERKIITTSRVSVKRPCAAIQEEGTPHRAYSEYLEYAELLKTGHLFREASRYVDLYEVRERTARAVSPSERTCGAYARPQRAIPMGKKVLTLFQNNIGTLCVGRSWR